MLLLYLNYGNIVLLVICSFFLGKSVLLACSLVGFACLWLSLVCSSLPANFVDIVFMVGPLSPFEWMMNSKGE